MYYCHSVPESSGLWLAAVSLKHLIQEGCMTFRSSGLHLLRGLSSWSLYPFQALWLQLPLAVFTGSKNTRRHQSETLKFHTHSSSPSSCHNNPVLHDNEGQLPSYSNYSLACWTFHRPRHQPPRPSDLVPWA